MTGFRKEPLHSCANRVRKTRGFRAHCCQSGESRANWEEFNWDLWECGEEELGHSAEDGSSLTDGEVGSEFEVEWAEAIES